MYSNDVNQISQGFDNFIGALITSLKASPEASKQEIVNILCNKIMNLLVNKDTIDMYVAKPYIKSIIAFLEIRQENLSQLKGSINGKEINALIEDYSQISTFFKNIIKLDNGDKI